MKKQTIIAALALLPFVSLAQQKEITPQMLNQIQKSFENNAADKAIRNAIGGTDIKKLALSQDNLKSIDTHFAIHLKNKGITNQESSGRCWLFTGLNVMRAKAVTKYKLPNLEFSQVYCFFWDQLEKANLFLQNSIDNADKPIDDQMVSWLFENPLSDGGTFTGVADLVAKYGLVPTEAMPETFSSNNTSHFAEILKLKLREFGLELRELAAKNADTQTRKTEMLGTVYRILALNFGGPPTEFDFIRKNEKGENIETEHHTPMSFMQKYGDTELISNYVMLMNDPTRDYYKVYEINMDRHVYEGKNWIYVNLPIDEIKEMAVASLKDSNMMYFSCDVGKFLNSKRGLLDLNNYDYESLFGTTFGMDKRQRIATHASGSSHAMTLCGVDFDSNEKTTKWLVENSWGASSGWNGYLIMTDEWFNEYMFRLVINEKYASSKVKKALKTKPIMLPAWDPMFLEEE